MLMLMYSEDGRLKENQQLSKKLYLKWTNKIEYSIKIYKI